MGIAVAPAPEDIGANLHRFVSFCWHVPDNDLCKRGNSQILCNQFPVYKTRGRARWNPKPILNIHKRIISHLTTITGMSETKAAEALVYYVYAVLCSTIYLTQFKGALFKTADSENRPRIPIPHEAKLFNKVSERGKSLAELEKSATSASPSPLFASLKPLFTQSFKLTSFSINEVKGRIDLFENSDVVISAGPVPTEVLTYEVAGYRVIQQWLKVYTQPYMQADFTEKQYDELLLLLSQIAGQIKIIKDIDPIVSPMLDGSVRLFSAA
jgi:predicted helicase